MVISDSEEEEYEDEEKEEEKESRASKPDFISKLKSDFPEFIFKGTTYKVKPVLDFILENKSEVYSNFDEFEAKLVKKLEKLHPKGQVKDAQHYCTSVGDKYINIKCN